VPEKEIPEKAQGRGRCAVEPSALRYHPVQPKNPAVAFNSNLQEDFLMIHEPDGIRHNTTKASDLL
jgi:hypothetical protein